MRRAVRRRSPASLAAGVVVSSVLVALSFPPFDLWILAFVGFIPLCCVLPEGGRGRFLLAWLSGFLCYGFLLCWLFRLAGPFFLLVAAYLGLYWALFFWLLGSLPSRGGPFLGASLWFFLELLVSNLLTGFPWLVLGLSQSCNFSLLPVARIAGVYGLSWFVMLANLSVFSMRRSLPSFAAWALVTASALFYGRAAALPRGMSDALRVLAVQSNIPSSERKDPVEILRCHYLATRELLREAPADLVLWPEGAFPDYLADRPDLLSVLSELAQEDRCVLILGTFTQEGRKRHNAAYVISADCVRIYRKSHLVPFGEYLPGKRFAAVRGIFYRMGGYIPDLSPGPDPAPLEVHGHKMGLLICFENVFPSLPAAVAARDAGFLVVITNDSWFGRSFGPYQHFSHNSLRAAETGRFVVQASLTGMTGVVCPDGRRLSVVSRNGTSLFVRGVLRESLPVLTGTTAYVQWGDVTLYLTCLLITGVLLCRTSSGSKN